MKLKVNTKSVIYTESGEIASVYTYAENELNKAEEKFLKICRKMNSELDEKTNLELLEDSNYSYGDKYVCLVWSNRETKIRF